MNSGTGKERGQGLQGLKIVAFESRQTEIVKNGIKRHGGSAVVAPSMQEIPLENNTEVSRFGELLMAGQVDGLILMTGVGTRLLIEILSQCHPKKEILKKMGTLTLVARGPKPVQALSENGLRADITVPEPNTWREILDTLDTSEAGFELPGKRIAIQEYGIPNQNLLQELQKRGVNAFGVPVYRWALPDDVGPLREAISVLCAAEANVSLFTSARQIRHVLKVAAMQGREAETLKAINETVVVSIGPTCTESLVSCGIPVDFEPSRPKLGQLFPELAEQAGILTREKRQGPVFRLSHRSEDPAAERAVRAESPFMKACRLEPTDVTPVWLMRQAGRYMKEYRRIRNRLSFLELCKTPELCAEVTVFAQEKIGADAAIIFSDLLLIIESLGLPLSYAKGDGPQIGGNLATGRDVDALEEIDVQESLSYVFDAVRLTRKCLAPGIPLIGFSGAPFTLVSYMIEGGASKAFMKTKTWMYGDEGSWRALMEKVVRGLVPYLNGQIEAGADAIQIFDSWVGCLGPEEYRRYVLPFTKKVIDSVRKDVPVIHFGTGTSAFLDLMREAGGQVIGVDFREEIGPAWQRIGHDRGVQGNLDPVYLFGDPEVMKAKVRGILEQTGNRPGHIFNLGHGILPTTPVERVQELIAYVHEESRKARKSGVSPQ